jgi:isopentenyl-diphosphate delta-isomerase
MQQRSDKKITFPGLWTNTCCSHPEHVADELDTKLDWIGPRRATIRRTKFEMGIDLKLLDLQCGSRILYYADADDKFTEYELDYIIFAKTNVGQFKVNPDEVKNYEYVSLRELDDFMQEKVSNGEDFTPWFKLIQKAKLV